MLLKTSTSKLASLWVVLTLTVLGALAPAHAVNNLLVEAPPAGIAVLATAVNLAAHGYVEQEYFISGAGNVYTAANTWTSNGHWSVSVSRSGVPFKTRIITRFPGNPAQSNGTVIIEWLNTTSGRELEASWSYSHDYIMRSGYAYVGVEVQTTGVNSVKHANPQRYASLSWPTDALSYDVFSQVAWACKQQGATLFGGSQPTRVLAMGASSSAMSLATYANAIEPRDQVIDGFLIQGRPFTNVGLNNALSGPNYVRIRTDVPAPVLLLQGEFDVITGQGLLFRQPDTAMVHTWEVAGASHESVAALLSAPYLTGSGLAAAKAPSCLLPTNDLHIEWVDDAAFDALNRWTQGLGAPLTVPPLQTFFGLVQRDLYGNALGGVRLPQIVVPRATYSIVNAASTLLDLVDQPFCLLAGATLAFPSFQDALLYPTNAVYVSAYSAAAQSAVQAGTLLQADANLAVNQLP